MSSNVLPAGEVMMNGIKECSSQGKHSKRYTQINRYFCVDDKCNGEKWSRIRRDRGRNFDSGQGRPFWVDDFWAENWQMWARQPCRCRCRSSKCKGPGAQGWNVARMARRLRTEGSEMRSVRETETSNGVVLVRDNTWIVYHHILFQQSHSFPFDECPIIHSIAFWGH